MRLGAFEISPVSDGRFRLDGGAMFGVVPKVLWERCCPADQQNRIPLAVNCLLVRAHDKLVLVDTGLGAKWTDKFRDLYAIERVPSLQDSLQTFGVSPDDVDVVVNTHLHFDHAGGNTVQSNETLQPAFPRATYIVQRGEYEDATRPNERTRASYRSENIEPIADAKRWELVDGDTEILPGVSVIVTGGHTRHHQMVKLESEGQTACFLGDLIPTAAHLPLPYIMGYDLDPIGTLEAKRRLLDQADKEGWLLVFEHDLTVQMGGIEQGPDGHYRLHGARRWQ